MSLHCSWRDVMREAAQRLAAAGVENAPREARLLLAHALGVEPVDAILRETDNVEPVALTAFEQAIERRLKGEPVSRIRGWREFYGRRFVVTPDVLDPRPETELLVEQGLKRLAQGGRVLDLGTGSGCILASVLAERPDAAGVGLDISSAALAVARRNAEALGVSSRAEFIEGGWDAALPGPFDLVLSNPPYIAEAAMAGLAVDVRAYDPHLALTPGGDGLDAYRSILSVMREWLKAGGWIGFEFGAGQAEAVASLMSAAGLEAIEIHSDLAGIERAAFGRSPAEPRKP
jgi:release factor glutamine methyltransferase